MLRAISRIRLCIAALGCGILGASLFTWAQALHATEDGYIWVGLDASRAPAIETAEIWQTAASCVRPFFVKAVLRSKAKLSAYYQLAPEEVRAWRNRQLQSEAVQPPADQKGLYHLVSGEPGVKLSDAAQLEYDATLHVQHAEWYATVSKLTIQQSQWEQRLNNVADQRVILSEATRKNFRAYSGRDLEQAGAKGDFEHYVLFLLGLGGFSSDDEQALKIDCVNIVAVKKIFNSPSLFGEIWHWPLDHIAAFALGLELVLVAVLFVPIALWTGTGDARLARRYIGDAVMHFVAAVRHFVASVRTLPRSEFVVQSLSVIEAALARTRILLTEVMIAAERLIRESRASLRSHR
jgi:hypothetical protein